MTSLMKLRRRGGQVIVVNPVKEVGLVNFRIPSDWRSLLFGSPIASLYVQPHIGGDIALLTGVAKIVLERDAVDRAFVEQFTEGFDAFRDHVRNTTWDEIVRGAGVEKAVIERLADMYLAAKNVVFGWTMGITHHAHGVANVRTIVNLALLRGMVGKQFAGLLPIRGHSNVQGIGSMGVAPSLKQAVLERLELQLGVKLPASPGLDTMGCMQAADAGQMKLALCLGGNLFGSNPDAEFAARAFGKLDAITYLSTSLNTGHVWGRARETLILPVLARDEECQKTTQESMFNFVRLSDGGRTPPESGERRAESEEQSREPRAESREPRAESEEPVASDQDGSSLSALRSSAIHGSRLSALRSSAIPRSEVAILVDIARRVVPNVQVNWQAFLEHRNLRQLIARIVPGYERLANIDNTLAEFTVTGRTFHVSRFGTPSGKAIFAPQPLPRLRGNGEQLRLMTVRSEGQFNTVVYEDEDIYRGQERRDLILMNPSDIDRLHLKVDQRVTVRSAAGEMHSILVRSYNIRAGNALMYYPEANALVPTTTDPDSKTPAFKSVAITLEPDGEPAPSEELSEGARGRVPLEVMR